MNTDMHLTPPRAYIFDWDNTLVNTWPIIHSALHNTFVAMGLEPWPLETTMARVRKSMRDSFPEIFGPNWEEAGRMYQQHYRANHLTNLEPLPGAEAVLKFLQSTGAPVLVVSNKKGPNLREEAAHLGWNNYFDSVIGSDDAARDKPYADPVHLALSSLEMPPGPDIWFIGDSDIDLHCARDTGCTPILYGDHAATLEDYTPTHFRGFPYWQHVRDHDQLMTLLKAHTPAAKKAVDI